MSKVAVEYNFTGSTTPITSYDSTKANLGSLIVQKSGPNPGDSYAGPMPISLARPGEAGTSIISAFPYVVSWSSTIDWVFLVENSTAAVTRRVVLYEFNKTNNVFTWKGFITLTYPTATAHTVRGFRMSYDLYTAGTVSVSGTTVVGTGTTWGTDGMCVGSRIGFGSTDPTQISSWYEIFSVNSDTSITLTSSAGTYASGSSYVIEDLRALTATTNATLTNGGLFVTKGLRYENFAVGGTTIPAAVATDNIRAVYWLGDASTVTNTIACGLAFEGKTSWQSQNIYVIDGTTTTCKVYKYNVRAALSGIAVGKSLSAYILATGAQTPTGTVSQLNNGRIATLNHGPGSGVPSIYFVTTTRVYRAALSNITSGNTAWQSDSMVEIPTGSISTFAATSVLSSVEISDLMDRIFVMSTGNAGARSYVTRYNTNSEPFDHIFLVDTKQQDQSTEDSGIPMIPSITGTALSVWSQNGVAYICRNGVAASTNQLYAVPTGAHWSYASTTNQRLVTPSIATPNCNKYYRVYINEIENIGSEALGMSPEPYRVYYRTSGISDNSGTWNLINTANDLSGVSAANQIQFMFEFKTIGMTCIPARIIGLAVVYEDQSTDGHYQPSVALSDKVNKHFAWRFAVPFGGTVPPLRVRLFDAVTDGLLVDDNTTTPVGTFEKSTDGGVIWSAYDSNDKTNDVTYIRYTPAVLGDNMKVKMLLTQL